MATKQYKISEGGTYSVTAYQGSNKASSNEVIVANPAYTITGVRVEKSDAYGNGPMLMLNVSISVVNPIAGVVIRAILFPTENNLTVGDKMSLTTNPVYSQGIVLTSATTYTAKVYLDPNSDNDGWFSGSNSVPANAFINKAYLTLYDANSTSTDPNKRTEETIIGAYDITISKLVVDVRASIESGTFQYNISSEPLVLSDFLKTVTLTGSNGGTTKTISVGSSGSLSGAVDTAGTYSVGGIMKNNPYMGELVSANYPDNIAVAAASYAITRAQVSQDTTAESPDTSFVMRIAFTVANPVAGKQITIIAYPNVPYGVDEIVKKGETFTINSSPITLERGKTDYAAVIKFVYDGDGLSDGQGEYMVDNAIDKIYLAEVIDSGSGECQVLAVYENIEKISLAITVSVADNTLTYANTYAPNIGFAYFVVTLYNSSGVTYDRWDMFGTSGTIRDVVSGTYTVKAKARQPYAEFFWNPTVTPTTIDIVSLSAPVLTYNALTGMLEWEEVEGADSYVVFRNGFPLDSPNN